MKPARVLLIEDDASIQRFVELALEDEPVTLHPAPTVAERVKASGTLRVCIWPDYYGITWRNPAWSPAASAASPARRSWANCRRQLSR